VRLFDETAQRYQELLKSATSSLNMELTVKEGQLTWLVYIIGAVIGGRASYNVGNSEEYDMFDGELVVRVLQLMTFMNTHLEQSNGRVCCEKLDLAMLNFFEQFRKIFIGEQMQKCSKVYKRMSEILGIHDETMWLNVVTRKM
jgi:exportin-7